MPPLFFVYNIVLTETHFFIYFGAGNHLIYRVEESLCFFFVKLLVVPEGVY